MRWDDGIQKYVVKTPSFQRMLEPSVFFQTKKMNDASYQHSLRHTKTTSIF